jgi:hypothetical protein
MGVAPPPVRRSVPFPYTVLACAACLAQAVQGTEPEECDVPRNGNRTEICDYVRRPDHDCVGDAWFPFLECYYCWVQPPASGFVFTGYLVWCCLLLYVLGTTADQYFAPALVQLSDWLGLRPRVAGVTLLALGNGAPDVFSVLAAYRAGQADLAVGALVGGSMFVTTVAVRGRPCVSLCAAVPVPVSVAAVPCRVMPCDVLYQVGAVITASGGAVKARGMFLRDVGFNIVGQLFIFLLSLVGRAAWWHGLLLFIAYISYVVAVVFGHRFPPMLRADREAWYAAKEARARASAAAAGPADLTSEEAARARRASIQAGAWLCAGYWPAGRHPLLCVPPPAIPTYLPTHPPTYPPTCLPACATRACGACVRCVRAVRACGACVQRRRRAWGARAGAVVPWWWMVLGWSTTVSTAAATACRPPPPACHPRRRRRTWRSGCCWSGWARRGRCGRGGCGCSTGYVRPASGTSSRRSSAFPG